MKFNIKLPMNLCNMPKLQLMVVAFILVLGLV